MNWDAIAAVAELLGALGVMASLAYLATELRSSGKRARQAGIQSVVNQMNTVWTEMAGNKSHAALWTQGSKGVAGLADETDRVQFSALLLSVFRPYEEIYHYRHNGLVDDWTWFGIRAQCEALMGTPGFAEWWEMRGAWFSPEFQAHVSETLGELSSYRRWDRESAADPGGSGSSAPSSA